MRVTTTEIDNGEQIGEAPKPRRVARAALRVTAESPRSLMRPPTRAPTTPTEPKFNGTDRKAVPRERLK